MSYKKRQSLIPEESQTTQEREIQLDEQFTLITKEDTRKASPHFVDSLLVAKDAQQKKWKQALKKTIEEYRQKLKRASFAILTGLIIGGGIAYGTYQLADKILPQKGNELSFDPKKMLQIEWKNFYRLLVKWTASLSVATVGGLSAFFVTRKFLINIESLNTLPSSIKKKLHKIYKEMESHQENFKQISIECKKASNSGKLPDKLNKKYLKMVRQLEEWHRQIGEIIEDGIKNESDPVITKLLVSINSFLDFLKSNVYEKLIANPDHSNPSGQNQSPQNPPNQQANTQQNSKNTNQSKASNNPFENLNLEDL